MLGFCHLGKPSVCRHAQIKPCSCHFSAGEERHNTKAFPRNTSKRIFLFFLFPKYSTYFAKHFLCMLLTAQICFATFFASHHHDGGMCRCCQIFRSDTYKIFFKSPLWLWLNVRVLPNIQIALFASFLQVFCKSTLWWWLNVLLSPIILIGFFARFFACHHHDGGRLCCQIFRLDFCNSPSWW